MEQIFCVVGKLPLRKFSKTRLAVEVGERAALEIYQALLEDFFSHYQKTAFFIPLFFYGAPRKRETQTYFLDLAKEFPKIDFHFSFQDIGPFFERLEKIYRNHEHCHRYLHLTGTDIPQFPYHFLPSYNEIKENEVVLGPDQNGGFYYFGSWEKNGAIFSSPLLFKNSSQFVLDILLGLCKERGLRVRLLKEWLDIDTLCDLERALLMFSPHEFYFTHQRCRQLSRLNKYLLNIKGISP